jgi:hypothetical protein
VSVNLSTGALSNGTTNGAGWTYVGSAIETWGDGWYRVSVTGTSAADTAGVVIVYLENPVGTNLYNGDGASGAYVWGAQLEAGAFASSYIPTTAATVTRNADVLTYTFAGNADATQGACYAELSTLWTTSPTAYALTFASAPSRLLAVGNGDAATVININDGTNNGTKTALASMATGVRKRASAWGGATMSITGDGAAVASGTFDGDMGSAAVRIGNVGAGTSQWFGTIKNVKLWKFQKTDAELQALTA